MNILVLLCPKDSMDITSSRRFLIALRFAGYPYLPWSYLPLYWLGIPPQTSFLFNLYISHSSRLQISQLRETQSSSRNSQNPNKLHFLTFLRGLPFISQKEFNDYCCKRNCNRATHFHLDRIQRKPLPLITLPIISSYAAVYGKR